MLLHKNVIRDLVKWIDDNIHDPINITDVMEISGYSRWHIQRLFREETGVTVGDYIRKKKIQEAANDLANDEVSILTISTKYGFSSQQTFTRIFSHYFHVPPGRWRKEQQK